jgi:signal transduction histidine kinase/ligand-binding sensor domain-containing protein
VRKLVSIKNQIRATLCSLRRVRALGSRSKVIEHRRADEFAIVVSVRKALHRKPGALHRVILFSLAKFVGRQRLAILAVWLIALVSTSASALTLAEYEHTSWGARDGIAGSVIWAREAPNGMLLMKTPLGYHVFDGVEFHSFERGKPPPLSDYDGALGRRSPTGAIYFIDPTTQAPAREWDGRTEPVEDKDNARPWFERLVFDPDGIGWFSHDRQLFRLDGLKVKLAGPSWGVPADQMSDVLIDARGTVWVCIIEHGDGVLYYLPRGAHKFERFADPVACFPIAQAPDEALWCANQWGIAVVTLAQGRPVSRRFVSKAPKSFIAFDRRGGFWAAGRTGLAHLSDWRMLLSPDGEAALDADRITPKEGLSSDGIWWIEEDSSGNVWVATGAGIDRFRATPFTPVKLPRRGWGAAIAADPDGSLWAGNYDRSLMHILGGRIEDVPEITQTMAIHRDARGRIWIAGQHGVSRKDPGGAFIHVDGPDVSSMPAFRRIAEDDSGAMWFESAGLFMRLRNGVWDKPAERDAPPTDTLYFMLADEQWQLWFVGQERGVFVMKNGALRELKSPAYATTIEKAFSAYARGQRVWVGGSKGVGAFVGDEFRPLKVTGEIARSITGIVETPEGDLWLHGLGNALRISKANVEAGLDGQPVTPEVFDFHDGLVATTSQFEPCPTLIRDATGRLWFSTTQGLFWIDSQAKQSPDAPPPQTLLRAVKSDGTSIPVSSALVLPPNPGTTEFSYVAAALGVADRVHFRYRLDGIDEQWQEAGTRRTAYYTQLPPGRHQFEVVASNEQGRWAESPTRLDFEVRAAWYQTVWFSIAVVLLSAGIFWWAYLLRVGVVASRERSRMHTITSERERIARDLHDTLLQGLASASLQLEVADRQIAADQSAKPLVQRVTQLLRQLVDESRQAVRQVRSQSSEEEDLERALTQISNDLAAPRRVKYRVVVEGTQRRLRPLVREEIYRIAVEALANAFRHADASTVETVLEYGRDCVRVLVRDDGQGIDPHILNAGREGHFGLSGLRERASRIGAQLTIRTGAGVGTEIDLLVPASAAFDSPAPRGLSHWVTKLYRRGAGP